jgi:hypothetical protein
VKRQLFRSCVARGGTLTCCLFGKAFAAAETAGTGPSAQAHFASDDLGLVHHLAIGLGCVVVIAVLGWLCVVLARRYGLALPKADGANPIPLRVLASRRVTQRLHIAAIQVSKERIVVIADNGHAIVALAEIPNDASSGPETGK